MIKKDCMMYLESLNKCNAMRKLDCDNCPFYRKSNKAKQKVYKNEMIFLDAMIYNKKYVEDLYDER